MNLRTKHFPNFAKHFVRGAALIAFSFSVSIFAASIDSNANRLLKQAVKQVEAGSWNEAIDAFEAAQATGAPLPESFGYHYGRALAKAKRYVEARVVLEGYLATHAEARFAKPALELLTDIRAQTDRQVRIASKVADALSAAAIKEREPEAEQLYKDGRYADALDLYQTLADHGSVIALRRLGEMYRNGQGVPRDAVEAGRWYARAVEKNDLPATAELGAMYKRGEGVPPNWTEAHRLLKKAAEAGNAYAMREFAFMVTSGRGQEANVQEGLRWLIKAAESAQPEAATWAGETLEFFMQPPNEAEALRWYLRGAENGSPESMYSLVRLYFDGRPGVPADPAAAQAWLDKALAAGSSGAHLEMARRALKQTPPDEVLADQWLERGAAAGCSTCAFRLSVRKTAANQDDEAVKWLQRGADLRDPEACFALSERYRLGQGVPKDPVQEARHLRCAAELGHGDAMYRVGKSSPPAEAVFWYERASRLNHADAIKAYKELLLRGEKGSGDPRLAKKIFQ